jgi:ABC-2 type transport system permease protein
MPEHRTACMFPESWRPDWAEPDAAAPLPPIAGADFAGPGVLSPRRLLFAYMEQVDFEIMRHLREPGFLLPATLLPALIYGMFLYASNAVRDPADAMFWLADYASIAAIVPGLYLFAVSAAADRSGYFALLQRALPVPPGAPIAAKLALAALAAGLGTINLLIVTWVVGGVLPPAGNAVSLIGIAALCSMPFSFLGMLIGTLASGKSTILLVHAVLLPLVVISGLVVPPQLLPGAILSFSVFSPGHDVLVLALGAVRPDLAPPPWHLVYLLVFGLVLGVLAQWRSRLRG